MAVWTTLMARATTVGPGGSARTACSSSSSHCRTTLSLTDGGYCSKVNSAGGSVRSSGGELCQGRVGCLAHDWADARHRHGGDEQEDEQQPVLHVPTFAKSVRSDGREHYL